MASAGIRAQTVQAAARATIIHVITDLGAGGAQTVLLRLATDSQKFKHIVVSLADEGKLARVLRSAGADVFALHMSRSLPLPGAIFRLARLIRRERPALVQTWLYHADLVGVLAAKIARFRPLAWNLRCSNMDLTRYRWSTRAVLRLLVRLSSWPDAVIVNSEAGRRWHRELGYRPKRWELVLNGVDTNVFRPDAAARTRWRQRLGIKDGEILIGMVARRDPMKDHEGMLRAAAEATRKQRGLAFVLAGRGVTRNDPRLARLAADVGTPVHLIDECDDPPGLNTALDIGVLSSAFGEGFPNVVAEAMATGVPCVVTDVGDAASIVGETGRVVPPRSPGALAQALIALAANAPLRAQLGAAARRRVLENFDLATAVARYEAVWTSLIAAEPLRRSPTAVRSAD